MTRLQRGACDMHQSAVQVMNQSRATAVLSFADAAAALRRVAVKLAPAGEVALRPHDILDLSLTFRLVGAPRSHTLRPLILRQSDGHALWS